MTIQLNTIHHGNCFDLLPLIPDGSVDAIITDPPYETTGLHFDKKGTIDWDLFYSEIKRVLKINGWFFIWGTLEMFAGALPYFRLKFDYVWVKSKMVFSSQSAVRPYYKHEHCFALIHPELKKVSELTFDRDAIREFGFEAYSRDSNVNTGEWHKANGCDGYQVPTKTNRTWRHGTTVLYAPIQQGYGHCTVKPLSLIETIVKGYTREGDTVLDPFVGSGTTAVACQNLNRNFIAMELHGEYVNIGRKRLKESFNLFTDDAFRTE